MRDNESGESRSLQLSFRRSYFWNGYLRLKNPHNKRQRLHINSFTTSNNKCKKELSVIIFIYDEAQIKQQKLILKNSFVYLLPPKAIYSTSDEKADPSEESNGKQCIIQKSFY